VKAFHKETTILCLRAMAFPKMMLAKVSEKSILGLLVQEQGKMVIGAIVIA
jgi:hypothetical protein